MQKTDIKRKRRGKGFVYLQDGNEVDAATKTRIASLTIPPAWRSVTIAANARSKVQVTGLDAKGRRQYLYSHAHVRKREAAKFKRITTFAQQLPSLRAQIVKDLRRRRFDKKKVVAAAVSLLDSEYFRVGNQAYAKENQTYGLTTLRSKHVVVSKGKVIFDFVGKSGQKQHKVIQDEQIAKIISKLDDMPGYELFRYVDAQGAMCNITSFDVNEYIKDAMGDEYSAKDFRTWGGTLLAAVELARELRPTLKKRSYKSYSKVC